MTRREPTTVRGDLPRAVPARWDRARAAIPDMDDAELEDQAAEAMLEADRLGELEAELRLEIQELEAQVARERAVSAQLRRDLEDMTRQRDAALVGRRESWSRGRWVP